MKNSFLLFFLFITTISSFSQTLLSDSLINTKVDSTKKPKITLYFFKISISSPSYGRDAFGKTGNPIIDANPTPSMMYNSSRGESSEERVGSFVVNDSIFVPNYRNIIPFIEKDPESFRLFKKYLNHRRSNLKLYCFIPPAIVACVLVGIKYQKNNPESNPMVHPPVILLGVAAIGCFITGKYLKSRSDKNLIKAIKKYNQNAGYGDDIYRHTVKTPN